MITLINQDVDRNMFFKLSSTFDVVDILNSLDILAVQENWLSKQNLSFLNSVHSDLNARNLFQLIVVLV